MRKGSKRIDWTVADEQFLIANAGKLPKRDICQMLKRSSASVRRKAEDLRKAGINVDLRYYHPTMEPCPKCGNLSSTINRTGMCEPCRRRDQLAIIEARVSELMPLLTPEQRDKYEQTEAKRQSRVDPIPEPPVTDGLTQWQKAYREEAYAKAVEATVAGNLRRAVKASQKRKERIEEHAQENQINGTFPDRSTKK